MTLISGLAIVAASGLAHAQENNQPPDGFTALFNGRDLTGWIGMRQTNPYEWAKMTSDARTPLQQADAKDVEQHWSVADGAIVNDGHGAFLTTAKEYGDVELWIDYKTVPKADSGIYLRLTPQVQIWDFTEEEKFNLGADKGSGGLWNNSPGANGKDPLVLADQPFGQWNRFRIIQVGATTSVWLNGKLVVDHAIMENFWDRAKPLLAKGAIQLQTHGGEIQWRNIFVKELNAEEAASYLAEPNNDQFTSLFNGTDLTGWQGATNNYQVVDGAIMCKPNEGGTLFTNEKYQDFVARLEFSLPPGGNNGLAIRYPGQGDPAYSGMCELQVLDSEHEKYAKLDPRQYHGSAYGMSPAQRGYLRPTGQWNFQEVTVKGPHIRVELNGTPILDTDLNDVTEFMANSPHPGKNLPNGYFGFAGHGDPVKFRNVRIKKLD